MYFIYDAAVLLRESAICLTEPDYLVDYSCISSLYSLIIVTF